MSAEQRSIGGAHDLLLRGYGPLVAFLALIALVTTLAPTIAPEQIVSSRSGGAGGSVALGGGEAGRPGSGSGPGGPASGGATTGPCPDRALQIPGDPYSPPCITFQGENGGQGDNGGATGRGVTSDKIRIAYRLTSDPSFQDAIASVGGGDVLDSPEAIERTAYGLVDYFNSRFQLYGRKIELVPFQGRGQLTTEILGGGQDAANNDAIKVANEVKAFADVSAISQPYSDALARQKVLGFGAPYMSREWFTNRRPYTWSLTPDCTLLAELLADHGNKRVYGRPARYADGELKDRPRRIAILAPDNPEYQQCVDASEKILAREGNSYAAREAYTLDLASLSSQAASLVAKLKADGITSVACGCDPILPVFLTAKAREQNWFPEWLVLGTALTDIDIVGQFYDQEEWTHAFGVSALGDLQPLRDSLGYHAYKSVRSDEPAVAVDILYYQLYLVAIGLQMAGPDLTPLTFEQGMFAYPGGTGPVGSWKFGPKDYTPMQDGREIWWDADAISVQNGEPGAYRSNGKRYGVGAWPREEPVLFR